MSDSIEALMAALAKATDGLLYPSESDEPFTPFNWPAERNETPQQAVAHHAAGKQPIVEQSTNAFFSALDETDDADRYQTLLNLLGRNLTQLTVIRVGSIRVDVYLIGQKGGQWVGLKALSIET